jgi:hypothetical protein
MNLFNISSAKEIQEQGNKVVILSYSKKKVEIKTSSTGITLFR